MASIGLPFACKINPAKWACSCGVSLLLSSTLLHAAPLVLFYNAQQQPKAWIDEKHQPNGFAYETAATILKTAQIEFTAKAVPFKRGIEMTKSCAGIMAGVFKTEQREMFLNYSQAIVADKAVVVSRLEDNFIYKKLEDLLNHKISYLRGASFSNAFVKIEPKLDKETQQSPATMLRLLAFKRVDLVILNPGFATVEFAAKAAGINLNKLRVSNIPLAKIDNYLVYCKDFPKTYEPLFKRINIAIKMLKKDGSFDEIMQRY
ncbi:MAG: transporter substrate-binding domain-containing protein [Oceanospirillaceae bacterium]|nr:transporter substrate-binding domain-containing protein [Oceanospirillaceae bacterium]